MRRIQTDDSPVSGHDDTPYKRPRDWRVGELVKMKNRKTNDEGEPEGTMRALTRIATIIDDDVVTEKGDIDGPSTPSLLDGIN
jgi:hypothetical protein